MCTCISNIHTCVLYKIYFSVYVHVCEYVYLCGACLCVWGTCIKVRRRYWGPPIPLREGLSLKLGLAFLFKLYWKSASISYYCLRSPTEEKGSRHTGPLVCSVGGGT